MVNVGISRGQKERGGPSSKSEVPRDTKADGQGLFTAQATVICDGLLPGSTHASRYLGAVLFIGHTSIYIFIEFLLTLARLPPLSEPREERIRTLFYQVCQGKGEGQSLGCVCSLSAGALCGEAFKTRGLSTLSKGNGGWGRTQSWPYTEAVTFCQHGGI